MNKSDSERVKALLRSRNHKPAKSAWTANLIVINCCSVRQSAMDRIYAQINKFVVLKKKIILAGCLLESDKKKLLNKNVSFWHPDEYFEKLPIRENKFRAFAPIMTGCNNFCAYCVVPFARGREKSRPAEKIIAEVKSLVKKEYKEIVLLGQNVNSFRSLTDYRLPTTAKNKKAVVGSRSTVVDFPELLRLINTLPGDFWLTFLTSHPKDMSDELIETVVQCQKISPHIHLPIQSGDNAILKKMNRHYTVAHYKGLIKKLRAAFNQARTDRRRPLFPPLAISTDIIVGFPGETDKQFQNTAKLMREIKFDMAYIARYSPRPGTAASKLKDSVSPAVKKCREKILNEILKKTALANNKKYPGKTAAVLVEEIKRDFIFGKTQTNKTVKFSIGRHPDPAATRSESLTNYSAASRHRNNRRIAIGQIVTVKIINAAPWGLKGKLC